MGAYMHVGQTVGLNRAGMPDMGVNTDGRAKGLPKCQPEQPKPLKYEILDQLHFIDEQTAINRFTWYNLPPGIDGHLIERILYYRGQGAFFYVEELDRFFFLPYANQGKMDPYGRYEEIVPLPFNGTFANEKEEAFVPGMTKKPQYSVELLDQYYDKNGQLDINKLKRAVNDKCVILHDSSIQYGQTNVPRKQLHEPLLDVMSNCIPFMNTALLNSTGIQGMRVVDEHDQSNVLAASASVTHAALTGQKYIPIVGAVDFQDLSAGNVAKSEEFMLAMQSLDNYRLSLYGLDNGGLFQKQSHMLQAEQEVNQGNVGLILQDALTNRQNACDVLNNIWGWGAYVEVSETVIGVDRNGDMLIGDTQDQSGKTPGQQPKEVNE